MHTAPEAFAVPCANQGPRYRPLPSYPALHSIEFTIPALGAHQDSCRMLSFAHGITHQHQPLSHTASARDPSTTPKTRIGTATPPDPATCPSALSVTATATTTYCQLHHRRQHPLLAHCRCRCRILRGARRTPGSSTTAAVRSAAGSWYQCWAVGRGQVNVRVTCTTAPSQSCVST